MDNHNSRSLQLTASQRLSAAPNAVKLVLLHTGGALALGLLLMVVDALLDNAIAGTGGLSGLGTRSILATVQSCLGISQLIILPFWQLGYTYITLQFARGKRAYADDLLTGFRLFLPALRLMLLQGLIYLAVGLLASHAGSFLFTLTPWSGPMLQQLAHVMSTADSPEAINTAIQAVLQDVYVPMAICLAIAFLALAAPVFYRLRFAQYLLLDNPEAGAWKALKMSFRYTKGNWKALLKLDLHFLWFYALDILVTVLAYGDALLLLLNVALPVSPQLLMYLFFTLYAAAQLGLYAWKRNEVCASYCLIYDGIITAAENTV